MTQIGIPPRSTTDWDVPAVQVEAEHLRWLTAHPESGTPAPRGELAHYVHLMHDADPDSTAPLFPDWTPGRAS